jgi:hypothetical protein
VKKGVPGGNNILHDSGVGCDELFRKEFFVPGQEFCIPEQE